MPGPQHSCLSIHHGTQYSQQPDGGGAGFTYFVEGETERLSNWPKVTQPGGNRARTSAQYFPFFFPNAWTVLPKGGDAVSAVQAASRASGLANSERSGPFSPRVLPHAYTASEWPATHTDLGCGVVRPPCLYPFVTAWGTSVTHAAVGPKLPPPAPRRGSPGSVSSPGTTAPGREKPGTTLQAEGTGSCPRSHPQSCGPGRLSHTWARSLWGRGTQPEVDASLGCVLGRGGGRQGPGPKGRLWDGRGCHQLQSPPYGRERGL